MLKISKEFAYWVGVMQTDGSFKNYFSKEGNPFHIFQLEVSMKSFPMLQKFQKHTFEVMNRKCKIYFLKKRMQAGVRISATKLLHYFEKLKINLKDPPRPPRFVVANSQFFGAYLAGVIDGDGDVRIKGRKNRRTPQCVIRVTSGSSQDELARSISNILDSHIYITKRSSTSIIKKIGQIINGTWYELEFLISRKNRDFIKTYVLPEISIPHKNEKIANFLSMTN